MGDILRGFPVCMQHSKRQAMQPRRLRAPFGSPLLRTDKMAFRHPVLRYPCNLNGASSLVQGRCLYIDEQEWGRSMSCYGTGNV